MAFDGIVFFFLVMVLLLDKVGVDAVNVDSADDDATAKKDPNVICRAVLVFLVVGMGVLGGGGVG